MPKTSRRGRIVDTRSKSRGMAEVQVRVVSCSAPNHQLLMSRSTLSMRPMPRRRPMFPSPSSSRQRLPRLSLSFPSCTAQSFQSRADKLSFDNTVSTRTLSSFSVQVLTHWSSGIDERRAARGGGELYGICMSSALDVLLASTGLSVVGGCSASKSAASRPGGSSKGTRRCLLGVKNPSL